MHKSIASTMVTLFLASIAVVMYIWKMESTPAITFFPLDPNISFNQATTSLTYVYDEDVEGDFGEINWSTTSTVNLDLYLRQDVSLLFANGRLRGVKSKWMEEAQTIEMEETLRVSDDTFWEAITFHHGEIHHSPDKINSIQRMSHNQLYVYTSIQADPYPFIHFKSALTDPEKQIRQHLHKMMHTQLKTYWNQLFKHFRIQTENYHLVPLTELYKYTETNLPSLSREETEQVIGRLWEGLYKNYIIPAASTGESEWTNYTPVILFDKKGTHLLVLFELNGKKEKLIQRYPGE